jgi:hypothetical protein
MGSIQLTLVQGIYKILNSDAYHFNFGMEYTVNCDFGNCLQSFLVAFNITSKKFGRMLSERVIGELMTMKLWTVGIFFLYVKKVIAFRYPFRNESVFHVQVLSLYEVQGVCFHRKTARCRAVFPNLCETAAR